MKYKWIKYKYWIYCLIPTLVVFLILYCIHPNECPDNARYILSAISQGLAAILALVFTITLLVAQMTGGFSSMDKTVFRHDTIFLVFIHGIGIISPLLVLNFGFWDWGVPLSIVIASFCVFSLFPFLIGTVSVLKYDIAIVNLNEEIMEAIESKNEAKAFQRIIKLESICKDAIKEFRKETTSNIIYFLSKISEKTIETKLKEVTHSLIFRLSSIGSEMIKNGFEDVTFKDHTLSELSYALGDLRSGVAKNKWRIETEMATFELKEIGFKAAEKGLISTTRAAIGGLKHIGTLDDVGPDINKETVRELLCLGAAVQEYLPKQVDYVIEHIIQLVTEAELDWYIVRRCGPDCVSDYPHLQSSFEKFCKEFERRYGKGGNHRRVALRD